MNKEANRKLLFQYMQLITTRSTLNELNSHLTFFRGTILILDGGNTIKPNTERFYKLLHISNMLNFLYNANPSKYTIASLHAVEPELYNYIADAIAEIYGQEMDS